MTEEQIRDLNACLVGVQKIESQMNLIVRLLNGNPDEDIVGVRPRLRQIEEKLGVVATAAELARAEHRIEALEEKWTALENKAKGASLAYKLLGVTNFITLAALLRFLLGLG